jgi:hypothetical protein
LLYEERNVCFEIRSNDIQKTLKCAIYGKTDAAIAETATFFWSLPHKRDRDPRLVVGTFSSYNPEHVFDFTALQPQQLVAIMDANPKRVLEIHNGTWSAEHAETLATRPYPIHLKFFTLCAKRKGTFADGRKVFAFQDNGRAFVEALEKRQFSFGSLFLSYDRFACDNGEMPIRLEYLERILRLSVFETFGVGPIPDKECAILPFVMTNALHYEIGAKHFASSLFASLQIVPRELSITLNLDDLKGDDWHRYVIAFLNRLSQLGHLERLDLSIERSSWDYYRDMLNRIIHALIAVIHANPRLKRLSLFDNAHSSPLEWTPFLPNLYRAMERHESLLSFRTKRSWSDDVDASLVQLLTRNQNISVYNEIGKRCFTQSIGKIYRDRFYRTSTELGKEPSFVRTSLVTTALTETASGHYQRAATLLLTHTDMLCEILQENTDTYVGSLPIAAVSPSEASFYRSHKRMRYSNVLYEF